MNCEMLHLKCSMYVFVVRGSAVQSLPFSVCCVLLSAAEIWISFDDGKSSKTNMAASEKLKILQENKKKVGLNKLTESRHSNL